MTSRAEPLLSLNCVWNYLALVHKLKKSDCILVLGGDDPGVARHAAHLYKEGWAKKVIITGGVVHKPQCFGLTKKLTEAESLKIIAMNNGVPEGDIFIENVASNTSENFLKTRVLIQEAELNFQTFIVVQKPYAKRRAYATAKMRWPDTSLVISSAEQTFEEYVAGGNPLERVVQRMLGEVERIVEYPRRGFMVPQPVPDSVLMAYENIKLYRRGGGLHEKSQLFCKPL